MNHGQDIFRMRCTLQFVAALDAESVLRKNWVFSRLQAPIHRVELGHIPGEEGVEESGQKRPLCNRSQAQENYVPDYGVVDHCPLMWNGMIFDSLDEAVYGFFDIRRTLIETRKCTLVNTCRNAVG